MYSDNSIENQIANLPFLEEIYRKYQSNPQSVDPSWIDFFQKFEGEKKEPYPQELTSQAERIFPLIEAYRRHGHLLAKVNPIALENLKLPPELHLENFGFQPQDEEAFFLTFNLLPQPEAPLKSIIEALKSYYCQTVGYEFKGSTPPQIEHWIQEQIESGRFQASFNHDEKLHILDILTRAEILETFLHTKHVGKKRFSLEGAETLIPMLTFFLAQAAKESVEEIFIGMSHRGRLNVLANILNKPLSSILKDFDEDYMPAPGEGMGDVRYHKGHANESVTTSHGKSIKLTMAPNPSHLESVNPVVEGQAHAKQFLSGDEEKRERIIPLLLHGDAALAGQGIVYETLQMSKLSGFETGGTVHIVINNQIGFTTSPQEGRSTLYCTDIAKTFDAPVFHVNAEDPEMCIRMAIFALEIRQKFHCDVFIDLNCYRKYGHNEGDEPAFTQPLEYQIIRKKKSIRTLYLEKLAQEGEIEKKIADQKEEAFKEVLQRAFQEAQNQKGHLKTESVDERKTFSFTPVKTCVAFSTLQKVVQTFKDMPSDFHVNSKIKNLFQDRSKAILEDQPFDWGTAELLAYGTLVFEGHPVRLAGQDSGRGTFSHRHALWVDQLDNHYYFPLAHIHSNQARFEVLNTCLSEAAALGFEYGYSIICAHGLNLWEAQFGDFVNSAQVMIDQYIASGEQKWKQTSNLVLLLPHGFEGQGPEHSSARFERFLALAGHDNMQIAYPSTPAQFFHLLRRQVKQSFQKPLIILTPKGLLRHSDCVSRVKDLTEGQFHPILDDPRRPQKIRRLVLCSGRIYYDLDAHREKKQTKDIALLRLEQLYPLNVEQLKNMIKGFGSFDDCQWVQEEPENMGAWPFISFYLKQILPPQISFSYVGRDRSATPATGFYAQHKQELEKILSQVFEVS